MIEHQGKREAPTLPVERCRLCMVYEAVEGMPCARPVEGLNVKKSHNFLRHPYVEMS